MPSANFDLAVVRPAAGVVDTFDVQDCALYIISAPAAFTLAFENGNEPVVIDANSPVRTIRRRDGGAIGVVKISNAAGAGIARLFYNAAYDLRIG